MRLHGLLKLWQNKFSNFNSVRSITEKSLLALKVVMMTTTELRLGDPVSQIREGSRVKNPTKLAS